MNFFSTNVELATAVEEKDYIRIEALLKAGTDPNILDKNNQPLIFKLVDDEKLLALFLERSSKRINVNVKNIQQKTVFELLVKESFCKYVLNGASNEILSTQMKRFVFSGASYSLDDLQTILIELIDGIKYGIREKRLETKLGAKVLHDKRDIFLAQHGFPGKQEKLYIAMMKKWNTVTTKHNIIDEVNPLINKQAEDDDSRCYPYIEENDEIWIRTTSETVKQYLKTVDTAIKDYFCKIESCFSRRYGVELTVSQLQDFLKINNATGKLNYLILHKHYFMAENYGVLSQLPYELLLRILKQYALLEKSDTVDFFTKALKASEGQRIQLLQEECPELTEAAFTQELKERNALELTLFDALEQDLSREKSSSFRSI